MILEEREGKVLSCWYFSVLERRGEGLLVFVETAQVSVGEDKALCFDRTLTG